MPWDGWPLVTCWKDEECLTMPTLPLLTTDIPISPFLSKAYSLTYLKSWLIWKDPDAGKDWGQEEKGTAEDEMVGWHHWLDGHGFGWTLGVGDGQGDLEYCSSWGCKESDTTEWLNWTELNWINLYDVTLQTSSWTLWVQMMTEIRPTRWGNHIKYFII